VVLPNVGDCVGDGATGLSPLTTRRTLVGAAVRAGVDSEMPVQVSLWRAMAAWKRAGPVEADGAVEEAMLIGGG
jgi:hypothetical protein